MSGNGRHGAGWGLLVILAGLGAGYALCGHSWRVAMDDGWELGKIHFVLQHPDLLDRVWNDQPWLHTLINAALCRWFGEGPWMPRLFTVLSVGAMWAGLAWLGKSHLGFVGLAFGALIWAGSYWTLNMSLGAVLEPSAFAWAVVSAVLFARAAGPWGWAWAAVSGVAMAAALHIKLTAAVVAPSLALLGLRLHGWRKSLLWFGPWLVGWAAAFAILAWISPSFRWDWLLGSHWAARAGAMADPTFELHSTPLLGTEHPLMLVSGVFGLWTLIRTGWPPVGMLALGVLSGAFLFKSLACPWWDYYRYHFELPLTVLGALAAGEAAQVLRSWWSGPARAGPGAQPGIGSGRVGSFKAGSAILVLSSLAALWVGFGAPTSYNLWAGARLLGNHPDPVPLQYLQEGPRKGRWRYAAPHHYPELVHCRLFPPPELLILPRKRFWSGQITWPRVTEYLDAYEVEWLILQEDVELAQPVFVSWLTNRYRMVTRWDVFELWRRIETGPGPRSPTATGPPQALQARTAGRDERVMGR